MNWDELTPNQRRAASATERRILVFGGAGSGKTTVALWSARHFLESQQAQSWHRVLFLTFSRTAVREISRRSGRALTGYQDRVEIHTFHAFANRVIASFGRYAGLGRDVPPFQSDARAKLFGRSDTQLGYDDLLPLVLKVVEAPRVKRLLAERWPIVICDEFQDTDDDQWELLCRLSDRGRLLLLADPNQMIYGFLRHRGVGARRVRQARELAEIVVDLGTPSHRDPTNVIPAMADAVRRRQFNDPAIRIALDRGRLRVHSLVPDDDLIDLLRVEIAAARRDGAKTIGIFGHGNQPVAELSANLIGAGIEHLLVGLPEAHGESLAALEALCLHGIGRLSLHEVRVRLAVFLTASMRGDRPPELALMLLGRVPLPRRLEERVQAASRALREGGNEGLEPLVRTAMAVWPRLGITAGRRPWNQASRTFAAAAQQILTRTRGRLDEFLAELARRVSQQRAENFFDLDVGAGYPIQLMNFHQTKGREADVVILVYRDGDWFGREDEPFPENSRLLYVSLTRARQRDIVILPTDPHPLVAPFAALPLASRA